MSSQNERNASIQEEEQFVETFLKILESMGEHASSFLFQKNVIRSDETYKKYEQDLNDENFKNNIINSLLRPSEKYSSDEEINLYAAILLQITCRDAAQMFFDINALSYEHIGIASGVVTLGYQLALVDRIAAFLGLPSINDKPYWQLITSAQQTAQTKYQTQTPPIVEAPIKCEPTNQTSSQQPDLPNKVDTIKPPTNTTGKKEVKPVTNTSTQTPSKIVDSIVNATKIDNAPNQSKRPKPKAPPPVTTNINVASTGKKTSASTPIKKPKKNLVKDKQAPPIEKSKASSSSKRDGPIQAMLREIVYEIHNDSFDAVINTLKDNKFMMELYKSPDNAITVKVLEVDFEQRVVYLVKKKRGQKETVKFSLIRKLLSEL